MSIQNKNTKSFADHLNVLAPQAGIIAMTLAATVGMLEWPTHPNARVVLPNQSAFAFSHVSDENNNPIRREQEETTPQFVSYSLTQRTPARSGKIE